MMKGMQPLNTLITESQYMSALVLSLTVPLTTLVLVATSHLEEVHLLAITENHSNFFR